MEIVITDLTRFKQLKDVCTAGIQRAGTDCIRPMPYLKFSDCQRLNIHPGAILSGDYSLASNRTAPHYEDNNYKNLKYLGACSSGEFKSVLERTCAKSVASGFDGKVPPGEKYIPEGTPPSRSIITLSVSPGQVSISSDKFNADKIKFHLSDIDGREYSFLPITDLGFYQYAMREQKNPGREQLLNDFIRKQKALFLRIGLSRAYASNGRTGFWIQVNGIYTFPEYLPNVRTY
jgi:hypothetical protein